MCFGIRNTTKHYHSTRIRIETHMWQPLMLQLEVINTCIVWLTTNINNVLMNTVFLTALSSVDKRIAYWEPIPLRVGDQTLTGKNEVTTLRHLHNLALLDKLTDTSTSAGTVDLQTIHNTIDGNELHLHNYNPLKSAYLGNFGKELVVIGLLEIDLVVDSISHLSLIPLLLY